MMHVIYLISLFTILKTIVGKRKLKCRKLNNFIRYTNAIGAKYLAMSVFIIPGNLLNISSWHGMEIHFARDLLPPCKVHLPTKRKADESGAPDLVNSSCSTSGRKHCNAIIWLQIVVNNIFQP